MAGSGLPPPGSTDVCGDTPRRPPGDSPAVPPRVDLLDLFQAGEQVGRIGSWEWLPRPDTEVWSDNLYRLLGLEPGEVNPSRAYLLKLVHSDDEERVTQYVELIRRTGKQPPLEYRIQHRTGGIRYLRSTVVTVESDARGPTRLVGAVQDVTDEHMTVREIAAHLAVSKTLAEWGKLDDGVVQLLCELGGALEFVFGTLWVPQDRALSPVATWSDPGLDLGELEAVTRVLRLPVGVALPGRAWRTRQPEILSGIGQDDAIRRRLIAGRSGLRGAVAFPALYADDVVAVVEFYHREDPEPVERLARTMVAIGREVGEFFSRRGAQLGSQHFTTRQLEVLRLASAGHTTPEIATELHLSSTTVRTHFDHIYEKLGVTARTAAVAESLRLGLID